MRVPYFLPTVAVLSTGMAGFALAQHEHPSGKELHEHLTRIFSKDGSQAAEVTVAPEGCGSADSASEAPEACCSADAGPDAAPVLARIQDGERGYMGIQMNVEDGAMVVIDVIDGSPAARAGLAAGDRIVNIGGHDVGGQEALTGYLAGIRPGQTESIMVDRNGWTKKIDLTFAARPDFDQAGPEVAELRERFGEGHEGLRGEAKGDLKQKIREKLLETGGEGQNRFFFRHDSDDDSDHDHDSDHDSGIHVDTDVNVEFRHEDGGEPQMRIRVNGEDIDLGDLEGLDLGALHLKGLSALKGIEGLECLEDLDCLDVLGGHDGFKGLVKIEGLDGLKGLHGLKGHLGGLLELKGGDGDGHHFSWRGGNATIHPEIRVEIRDDEDSDDSDDGHFSWFSHDDDHGDHDAHGAHEGHGEVSDLRAELRELRNEMRELRRERLTEVQRLRDEVRSLLRSLDK